VLNAAVNARDAMPKGGRLVIATRIESEGDSRFLRLSISDNGLGMPQRVVERAFEPFFTTKEVGKGTGLGLSQIHGFAAQAGGKADIESLEGAGTTISILLPVTDEPLPIQPDALRPSALPPGCRVLLVEDNRPVREFAQELLVDLGCEVVTAGGAREALEALGSGSFDLVFTDVVMPETSGVELAWTIRREKPGLPVLLATGYSEELLKTDHDFMVLAKPYDGKSLVEAMAAALAGSQARLKAEAEVRADRRPIPFAG
jgi:CheY-like chemotaxis protein